MEAEKRCFVPRRDISSISDLPVESTRICFRTSNLSTDPRFWGTDIGSVSYIVLVDALLEVLYDFATEVLIRLPTDKRNEWYSCAPHLRVRRSKLPSTLEQSVSKIEFMRDGINGSSLPPNLNGIHGSRAELRDIDDVIYHFPSKIRRRDFIAHYLPLSFRYIEKLEKIKFKYCAPVTPKGRDAFVKLPPNLQKCVLYASLFPQGYKFDKDILVYLWIASGFIDSTGKKLDSEDVANDYFEQLLAMSLFYEHTDCDGKSLFTVGDDVYDLLNTVSSEFFRLEHHWANDIPSIFRLDHLRTKDIPSTALHVAVLRDLNDPSINSLLWRRSNGLHSLIVLHPCHVQPPIKRIPQNLSFVMGCLRVLVVNDISLQELSLSFESFNGLRYLDLSQTPIQSLPSSVTKLSNLLVLRLKDCPKLTSLPDNMNNLTNLRYLDLDGYLSSRPYIREMGKLTNLRRLNAFHVGIDDGFRIEELKHMNNLRGSLGIRYLDYVNTKEEAERAELKRKIHVRKLSLSWIQPTVETKEVLDGLEPHGNLLELTIRSYQDPTFSSWLANPSVLSRLCTLRLHCCHRCNTLPPLGQLPLLRSLQILSFQSLSLIDRRFCGDGEVKGFPKLETLHLKSMSSLEEWTGVEEGDFGWLRKLVIEHCPKLICLPELLRLTFLSELKIFNCSILPSFGEGPLPTSLQRLDIALCPLLERRCIKEKGTDWHKIASIPSVTIDHKDITKPEKVLPPDLKIGCFDITSSLGDL